MGVIVCTKYQKQISKIELSVICTGLSPSGLPCPHSRACLTTCLNLQKLSSPPSPILAHHGLKAGVDFMVNHVFK